MAFTLIPFQQTHLEAAAALFTANYAREREQSPQLPSRVSDDPAWIRATLRSHLANPGVAVIENEQLLAYMLTGVQFPWKGQQAAWVPEYCHAATTPRKQELYQRMYIHLAQQWVDQHRHIHLVGYLAHDKITQETLYELGFGAILAERLRDLSDTQQTENVTLVEEKDVHKLIDLQTAHNHYYPQAPIFIRKSTQKEAVIADLEAHAQQGDTIFTCYEHQEPCAYAIVGESARDAEGFLLRNTNTAQIKSAYARPEVRGKGIGKALLQRSIQWAQQHGYERLFVEHETANFYGGNFWRKHFTPYMQIAMRYVDNTI